MSSRGSHIGSAEVQRHPSVGKKEDEHYLSYWDLFRRRFFKNKLAVAGGLVIIFMYTVMLPAEFTAPYDVDQRFGDFVSAPPQRIHLVDATGKFRLRPFVYRLKQERDSVTLRRIYSEDHSAIYPLSVFVRDPKGRIHLFGVQEGEIFLLGTDGQGRDVLSRLLHGGRTSLTVGFVGVFISLFLGSIIGLVSGYFGGRIDNFIQRAIEVLIGFPALPLWMAISAAVPPYWNPIQVFFAVTVILSIINWGRLARVVRGMTLSIKNEDYVMAAKVNGAGTWWIVTRHLLTGNLSYLIVRATLAIPAMILAESALSFLGLGIRAPMTSLGVLLQQAQNVAVIAQQPWLISPVVAVVVPVLCFNFLGDGFRDAADPFSNR